MITTILTSAVISALVGGSFNIITTKKTIKSQVVSKARHEWIQEVRNLVSEYLSKTYNFYILIILNVDNETMILNEKDYKILQDKQLEIQKLSVKIRLFFGEYKYTKTGEEKDSLNIEYNSKIKKIERLTDEIETIFRERNSKVEESEEETKETRERVIKLRKELDLYIENVTEYTSKYLKTEWEKTKNNK